VARAIAHSQAQVRGIAKAARSIRNVIVLVPDGCSQSVQTLARWYKGSDLCLDAMQIGVAKHEMANSVITGSAAAATAFATGYKTTVRFLSVGPRDDDVLSTYVWPEPASTFSYLPLATVLEGARLVTGKATGLISTSRFTHATTAAFACHSVDRGNENTDIAEHMVYNALDLANIVADVFGIKMAQLNDFLYVSLDDVYTAWTLDESDPMNPVAVVDGRYATAELPCSKDVLTITTKWGHTRTFNLPGVVVHAEMTGRVYASQEAIAIMAAYGIY